MMTTFIPNALFYLAKRVEALLVNFFAGGAYVSQDMFYKKE